MLNNKVWSSMSKVKVMWSVGGCRRKKAKFEARGQRKVDVKGRQEKKNVTCLFFMSCSSWEAENCSFPKLQDSLNLKGPNTVQFHPYCLYIIITYQNICFHLIGSRRKVLRQHHLITLQMSTNLKAQILASQVSLMLYAWSLSINYGLKDSKLMCLTEHYE